MKNVNYLLIYISHKNWNSKKVLLGFPICSVKCLLCTLLKIVAITMSLSMKIVSQLILTCLVYVVSCGHLVQMSYAVYYIITLKVSWIGYLLTDLATHPDSSWPAMWPGGFTLHMTGYAPACTKSIEKGSFLDIRWRRRLLQKGYIFRC